MPSARLLKSRKQNPCDRTLDLPCFFCLKHITSLKTSLRPYQVRVCTSGFGTTFVTVFVLNCWLREFLLSAFANRFELRCEPKQLMLPYYKICPCWLHVFCFFRSSRKFNDAFSSGRREENTFSWPDVVMNWHGRKWLQNQRSNICRWWMSKSRRRKFEMKEQIGATVTCFNFRTWALNWLFFK